MGKRLHRKVYPYILLAIGFIPNVWAAVTQDDLSLVEDEINTIKEERDTATKLSGYVDAEYINDSRESATMNAVGDKYGFRIRHLSLFVTKKFDQNWSFFSEAEFEDGTFIDSGGPASNTSGSITPRQSTWTTSGVHPSIYVLVATLLRREFGQPIIIHHSWQHRIRRCFLRSMPYFPMLSMEWMPMVPFP